MTATEPPGPFRSSASGTLIDIRVIPRSPKNVVGGLRAGRLLVRVTAAPVDQAANEAVVQALAAALGVSQSRISIVAGFTSRNKRVEVNGLAPTAVRTPINC